MGYVEPYWLLQWISSNLKCSFPTIWPKFIIGLYSHVSEIRAASTPLNTHTTSSSSWGMGDLSRHKLILLWTVWNKPLLLYTSSNLCTAFYHHDNRASYHHDNMGVVNINITSPWCWSFSSWVQWRHRWDCSHTKLGARKDLSNQCSVCHNGTIDQYECIWLESISGSFPIISKLALFRAVPGACSGFCHKSSTSAICSR